MNDPICPLIHLNGSGEKELYAQINCALASVENAIAAMRRATPHGRDYYPLGDEAYNKARRQHEEQLAKLTQVSEYYSDLSEKLYEQMAQRAARRG